MEKNTNYQIKIYSFFKDLQSEYSEIKKIKIANFNTNIDSVILNETERKNEFLEKLYEWTGYNNMILIYRGTRDGYGANIFHNEI